MNKMKGKYERYRKKARVLEDQYHRFCDEHKSQAIRIAYLYEQRRLHRRSIANSVATLRLLAQEIATEESRDKRSKYGITASSLYVELYQLADFDPLSLTCCANYFHYDTTESELSKTIALYAAFVAESVQAYVRHSQQVLFRIATAVGDRSLAEASLRRILTYDPSSNSPDPAIERDVIEIARKMNIGEFVSAKLLERITRVEKN